MGPAPPNHLDAVLDALADPTRRGVVELLRAGPRRAGELARELAVTPPSMSKHLRLLLERGLVSTDERSPQDARVRLFRLRPEPFGELSAWLAELEGFSRRSRRTRRPRAGASGPDSRSAP